MRINISAKMFFGFLVVIFMNVFFFVIVTKLEDLNSITSILKRQNEIKSGLLKLRSLHNGQGISALSYERAGRPESVQLFRETNKSLVRLIDTLTRQIDTVMRVDSLLAIEDRLGQARQSLTALRSFSRNINVYNSVYNNMFDSLVQTRSAPIPPKDIGARSSVLREVMGDAESKMQTETDSALATVDLQTNVRIKDVEVRIRDVKQITLFIIAGMTIIAIVFGSLFSRAITNSLRRLKESASTIGRGDFDFNPSGYPNDEIGDVAAAFFDMAVDLKNAQEELVRSKRLAAIGEVVASVNHEINNPLMIISGNAQFLEMMLEGYPGEMKERVRAILEETERISMVTRKLREIKNPIVEDYTSSGEQMINLDKSSR